MMAKVLVTGGAGFIGSHICDRLIQDGNDVVCIDSLITSQIENIEHLFEEERFTFLEGDIRDSNFVDEVMDGCTHVSHQAALGSVPRSVENPVRTNEINITGGLNVLVSAQRNNIQRVVFASSSSVYGDDEGLPKVEHRTGECLSPYAVSKMAFEKYAKVFYSIHGLETIGLRYFNVFGPRQSPSGPYAAVIPKFVQSIMNNESPKIFGDGEQTRDFTFVGNVVEANMSALFRGNKIAFGKSINIAYGNTISINELFIKLRECYSNLKNTPIDLVPEHTEKRSGDIMDSLADLTLARKGIGYSPDIDIEEGILETVSWMIDMGETG